MKIGYARIGAADRPEALDTQLGLLARAGCETVFSEQTALAARGAQLAAALGQCGGGDTLVVPRLDCLAPSLPELVKIADALRRKAAHLSVLDPAIDTATSAGRTAVNAFAAAARFEHDILLERQREGVARAKSAGRYKGRVPTARRQAGEIAALRAQGVKPDEIARRLNIGRSSVFRILKEQKRTAGAG